MLVLSEEDYAPFSQGDDVLLNANNTGIVWYPCRDITLPTKVHLVKAMVFPVVMYGWRVGL